MSDTSLQPWVSSLLDELHSITKDKILQLSSIIHRMGMDESSKEEWIIAIKEQTAEMLSELIADAQAVQEKLVNSIEELLQKSWELCKLLQIQMPQHGSEELSFFEEREMLRKKVNELEAMVASRKQELDALRKRQMEACQRLGREPECINDSPLPNAQQLDKFAEHIKALELEVFEREDRFINLKCKIVDIVNELGIKPTLDIEKTVLSSDDSTFKVTDHNMKWIEEYHICLQKQQEDVKLEILSFRERVASLWDMLSEDIKARNEFLGIHVGNSIDNLEAWKTEWKRCENLKKANIEKFVKDLRKDLSILWERCHLTKSQRDEFEYFHCTIYTEDLLTFHDLEIKKLQKFYEDNKEIFTLLEKWQQSWNKMIELEERACAPNRFKNRGGTLLREEKERNQLQKRLPEYEDRLAELASNFQCRTGKPFLSWGETIADLVGKAHDNYKQQKETKLSARKQQRDQQATTPAKLTLGLGSMISGSKQNLHSIRTPQASSSKKRPPLQPLFSNKKREKVGTPRDVPKIKVNDQTLKHRSRTSLERQKQLRKIRTISKNMENKKPSTPSDSTEYDIFKREMSTRQGCRSTLFEASTSDVMPLPLPQTPKSNKNMSSLVRTPKSTKFKTMPGSTINI